MEKPTYRTHRDWVYYNDGEFPGLAKIGSLVERTALANLSIEEETLLTPEQLQEIEENDYWTPLYNKTLPETPNGIKQDDIIESIEHGKLPGGFTYEGFVEYISQDDLDSY